MRGATVAKQSKQLSADAQKRLVADAWQSFSAKFVEYAKQGQKGVCVGAGILRERFGDYLRMRGGPHSEQLVQYVKVGSTGKTGYALGKLLGDNARALGKEAPRNNKGIYRGVTFNEDKWSQYVAGKENTHPAPMAGENACVLCATIGAGCVWLNMLYSCWWT